MVGILEDGNSFDLEVTCYIEECRRRYNCGYDTAAHVLERLTWDYNNKNISYKLIRMDGAHQLKLLNLDEIPV